MIAVVVSSADQWPSRISHPAAALNHYWKDDERLTTFIDDCRTIELSP
ncbi:hypothetical protein IH601_03700 [Candidatus Bipolaricaulota bacterium]|nr:hypothetical protein [Candidatus Bipolaricaulota bacterium]